jgi:peptidoglycan/xylan/chitin deacetylase (PgdA/CDA1 family)
MTGEKGRQVSDKITLTYHSINECPVQEPGAGLYCVSRGAFRAQMEYVSNFMRERVIITFDDGDITNYTQAMPVLSEFGLTAYFFLIVSRVGADGYMNWDQVRELKDKGMIIGSHGMTHRILDKLSAADLDNEIRQSKQILEKELVCEIKAFSVPRGFCSEAIIGKAKSAGYQEIFTSGAESAIKSGIGRITVRRDWDIDKFKKVLSGQVTVKDILRSRILLALKKLLGSGLYNDIRSRILSWN